MAPFGGGAALLWREMPSYGASPLRMVAAVRYPPALYIPQHLMPLLRISQTLCTPHHLCAHLNTSLRTPPPFLTSHPFLHASLPLFTPHHHSSHFTTIAHLTTSPHISPTYLTTVSDASPALYTLHVQSSPRLYHRTHLTTTSLISPPLSTCHHDAPTPHHDDG